jgi:CheY-like chemotaxis protein
VNALVLLVDDSGEDLAIALRALDRAKLPLDVYTARNGREALAALHLDDFPAGGEPLCPQVIFLDVKMPEIDGFEVLRTLRRAPRTRAIPVVMVSTSARTEDVRRAYELGANSYLVKRIDSRDPGAFIAQAARYWVELNFVPLAG